MIKQKKGELSDMLVFLITIFVFAIVLFIFVFIIPQITGGLRTAGMNNSVAGTNAINSTETMLTGTINNGFMILFVGLILSILITSFLVRTHPIFMILYIFFLGVTILLSFYLGNVYYSMQTNPIFASALTNATFITLVMNHIAEIVVAVGVLSLIVIFSKFSTYGGTQPF
jgi:hypothetical protein